MQRSITTDHAMDSAAISNINGITVLDDLTADVFDLDIRAVPVQGMTGSNTTSQCTDNGCSSNCQSVGCSQGCGNSKGC